MTTFYHGPPGKRAHWTKNARSDLPGWIADSGKAPCAAPVYRFQLWLTCQHSVCQDFLFLNVTF